MDSEGKSSAILGIGTAVPEYRMEQADAALRLAEALEEYPDSARWAKRIFRQSGVETRYTCDPALLEPAIRCRYLPHRTSASPPSTAERMDLYKRMSVPLGLKAAQRALADSLENASSITHLITVSCTGQFLPGLDAVLTEELGLSPTVNRIPLTFLGCAAGLKAVILASDIVSSRPDAKILVVCVELCTLHVQPSAERDDLYAASFFGDGASACVVGQAGANHRGIYQLGLSRSVLFADSAGLMKWDLGDFGFKLYLSPDIPREIGSKMPAEVRHLLGEEALPELWAIHPGGRGILDILERVFGLSDRQTEYSRSVLRKYGNLSSATILFVLDELKRARLSAGAGTASGIAIAFGPGLTAEMIRFVYVPASVRLPDPAGAAHV
jgi:predicted naringenin-chalcone synthase